MRFARPPEACARQRQQNPVQRMQLYLYLLSKGKHLYDYKGNEFLSANDVYDFAETTGVQGLR
jgi:hypothetical protein